MNRRVRGIVRSLGVLALVTLACATTGCVLGPDYARPTVEVPQTYRFAGEVAAVSTLAEVPSWWRSFGDSELDALVAEGLAANHDLRIATARVDEFAARVIGTRAQGLPQVGYGATAGRQGVGSASAGTYSTVLSARWELDLWGRIRSGPRQPAGDRTGAPGRGVDAGIGRGLWLRHAARPGPPPSGRAADG